MYTTCIVCIQYNHNTLIYIATYRYDILLYLYIRAHHSRPYYPCDPCRRIWGPSSAKRKCSESATAYIYNIRSAAIVYNI